MASDKIRFEGGGDIEYEPTDSENDYSDEEKEILKEVRQSKRNEESDEEIEINQFADSDIESEEDIEDKNDVQDWGDKAKNYYNTDFVDQDYDGYNEQEEEMANEEGEEAKIIQQRLLKQMKEEDFLLDEPTFTATVTDGEHNKSNENVTPINQAAKIKADLQGLTKREKQRLFQEDSPEFAGLVANFFEYIRELDELLSPVLQYVKDNNVHMIPALKYAKLCEDILLAYCTNVCFYLVLKAKRLPIKNHPVTKRLVQLKQLFKQLEEKYNSIIKPQLEALLERIVDGDVFEILNPETKKSAAATTTTKPSKKSKLSILNGLEDDEISDNFANPDMAHVSEHDSEMSDDDDDLTGANNDVEDGDDMDVAGADDTEDRRGISYQIAKNKGLTPHRKKEARNPRVKHRNKFRKALIRRKGAVRTVRKETQRYGGEISGIKATVSKSVKFRT